MNLNEYFQSKTFRRATMGLGLLIVIVLAFGLGIFVGFQKAQFSYKWGDNYDRNFGGPRRGIFGFVAGSEFTSAHGAAGSVLSVNPGSSSVAITGEDNVEKTILITSTTLLREDRNVIAFSDIEIGEPVVVLGAPNDTGQIEARFLRVFSAAPLPSVTEQ